MTDTALLAVLLAGIAGLLAGRAWAAALRAGTVRERASFRSSPHYLQGLQSLAAGHIEIAISELTKVARDDPNAVEVSLILGNLLREAGQVERAIQMHQALLERNDLVRVERAQVLACLGNDYRRAGFLDRATRTFEEVLRLDSKNIHALIGTQKLHEEQRQWREAYGVQTRLSRLRKTDDSLVLGYLQAEMGLDAMRDGLLESAEKAFQTALTLDRRVLPAHLGLADLHMAQEPTRAAAVLEEAIQIAPERAYLTFDRLSKLYGMLGQPERFVSLCERMIERQPRDWRARLALARHVAGSGRHDEAFGLLIRAIEANPQVPLLHLQMWRILHTSGLRPEMVDRYMATAEEAVFYRDPHICTACRYRADTMLWRCPHCHEWNRFVEERVGPRTAGSLSEG